MGEVPGLWLAESVRDTLVVRVPLPHWLGEAVGVRVEEGQREAEGLEDTLSVLLGQFEPVMLRLAVGVESQPVPLGVAVLHWVTLMDCVAELQALAAGEGLPLTEKVPVTLMVSVAEAVCVVLILRVALLQREGVTVAVPLAQCVGVAEPLPQNVPDWLGEGLVDTVTLDVTVWVPVTVQLVEAHMLCVEEGEALLNREELLFEEGVPVALRQRETVAEPVAERDRVSLWYGVQVTVEVARSDTR